MTDEYYGTSKATTNPERASMQVIVCRFPVDEQDRIIAEKLANSNPDDWRSGHDGSISAYGELGALIYETPRTVKALIAERDEWKAKVQEMNELNQKISDESLALVEKYGAQAKEAYALLHLLANQPSVVNTPWGEQLSAQVSDHLRKYKTSGDFLSPGAMKKDFKESQEADNEMNYEAYK